VAAMGREPSQLLAVAPTTRAAVTKVGAVGKRASVVFILVLSSAERGREKQV
jgi:hypothetical protein